MAQFLIRPARPADGPALARIHWRADALFLSSPHPEAADPAPAPAAAFARLAARRALLVAAAGGDAPVGVLGWLPGRLTCGAPVLHVAQLSVDPAWMRRGVGGALLEAAAALAGALGCGAVTLTTYADVAWNAPFYAARGFAPIPPEDWPAHCRGERDRMAALAMPVDARVAMIRML